jgi:chromosomal replication initiator protein
MDEREKGPTYLSLYPWLPPLPVPGQHYKRGSVKELMEIAERTAAAHGVTVQDLKSQSRERRIAWPRQEAMAWAYETCRFSLTRIGAFYNRDHTTVLHGIRAAEKRRVARAAATAEAFSRALTQQEKAA